jgi:hypothetical protein
VHRGANALFAVIDLQEKLGRQQGELAREQESLVRTRVIVACAPIAVKSRSLRRLRSSAPPHLSYNPEAAKCHSKQDHTLDCRRRDVVSCSTAWS